MTKAENERGESGGVDTEKAEYTRAQFEGAYRSLVQMIHAVGYIEIPEVQRWILKVTEEDSAERGVDLTKEQLDGRARVLKLFDNMQVFKETLQETGVPPVPPVNVQGSGRPRRQ